MRRRRQEGGSRSPGSGLALGCSAMLSLAVVTLIFLAALVYADLAAGLPSLDSLPLLLDPPDGLLLQPTQIYDRTGQHLLLSLDNPAAPRGRVLTLDPSQDDYLPTSLISATLASADPAFYTHSGFSWRGIFQGAHFTLAQRLASDLLLVDEPAGLRRALRERLLAAQLTRRFGRQQVLIWYLNSASYGRYTFGADTAARAYFGKPAARLTLAEAAILAATAEAPDLNPHDAPQLARERGRQVLRVMTENGFITNKQARQAQDQTIAFRSPVQPPVNLAPALTRLALEQAEARFSRSQIERGGLRLITTLDYALQLQMACAASNQLGRLQNRYEEAPAADGSPCLAARLLPTLTAGADHAEAALGAEVVVLDPASGQVLALASEKTGAPESSRLSTHPAGTLLTPLVYLTGFTRGLGPASLVWDIPIDQAESSSDLSLDGLPANLDQSYHGPQRLRMALANDYASPALQMADQFGLENVWRTALQLGLTSLAAPEGLFSAAGRIPLLEAAQMYAVFANQGALAGQAPAEDGSIRGTPALSPWTVRRIEKIGGPPLLAEQSAKSRPVISPQLAYLMTNILSDESARWPSLGHPNPLEIGRPAAAKLGRTLDGNDTWAVGYTSQLVIGVWIGAADTTPAVPLNANAAAALWHALMQYASRDLSPVSWPVPAGISTVQVCDPSGLLPSADCPTVVSEVFLNGTEPTQVDTLYRSVQLNRETGRLATVFTPPDQIERRVYLQVPPEAQAWVRQAGIPSPPETYDVIFAPQTLTETRITAPSMFSYVHGQVAIKGSASGNGFQFYRLQTGQGLNPQTWLQVGQDVSTPVTEGQLGVWDTSGLSGLYALQLLVVRQNQGLDTAIIQVTVDNQSPTIAITSPLPGQEISLSTGSAFTFHVNASDDLALKSVELLVDGRSLAVLSQAPYTLSWQASHGAHTLQAIATDMAGNQTQTEAEFTVK
jgi:membrane peptidoglycan carboxypeptidase